jgi:DinB superfamily
MSFRDATRPQDLGPERLKPAEGAPILDPSVEAEGRATDLCAGPAPHDLARARILAWLAEGAREVTWALCRLPCERWAESPPVKVDAWPALRHVRHIALYERHQILPAVCQVLGETTAESSILPMLEIEQADAAWDTARAVESPEGIVQGLGETRFELLRRLEATSDDVWQRPLPAAVAEACGVASPVELDWLLLSARQHEQQHMAAVWRIALNWDRVSLDSELENAPRSGVPLHPADRLEESH